MTCEPTRRPWLHRIHSKKRRETGEQVLRAIESLLANGREISLSKIQVEVRALYARNIAASTILRNTLAAAHYRKYKFGDPARNVVPRSIISAGGKAGSRRFRNLLRLSKPELAKRLTLAEIKSRRQEAELFNLRNAIIDSAAMRSCGEQE